MMRFQIGFAKRYMCVFAQNASKLNEEEKLREYVDKNIKTVSWENAKPFHAIPGPKPIPIFGNVLKFFPVIGTYYNVDLVSLQERLRKEYGDIIRLSDIKFRNDSIILFNPDDISWVFRNEGPWPDRPELQTLKYFKCVIRKDVFNDGGGILGGQGKDWYNSRVVANVPLMQPRSALQYLDGIDQVAQEFSNNVRKFAAKNDNGEMPENFLVELNKFSMESINLITLNKRIGLLEENTPSSDSQKFIKCISEFIRLVYELEFKLSMWKYISTPKWRQFVQIMNFILEFQMKNYNEAISKIDWKNLDKKEENELTILEKMLKKNKEKTFSVFFDVMFGSVDTSSRTIGAVLYFLAVNPEAQEKLRQEVKKCLPKPDSPLTKEALNEMSYLRAVIKETQRFAPIAVFGARRAVNDIVISGYQIPKGTELLLAQLLLCKDEKYFHHADKFLPERWLRGQNSDLITENANPFVYMPFGFGVRMCIGRRLAQLQMETLLSRLVRNFNITWPHGEMKWVSNISYGVGSPLKFHMKPLK